jgi:hypothetical protein
MAMAAAGVVLATSISASAMEDHLDAKRLQLTGESAMLLAMRYMRDYVPGTFNIPADFDANFPVGDTVAITPGYPGWDQLLDNSLDAAMGSPQIRAGAARQDSTVLVLAWATYGRDTVRVSWRIQDVAAAQVDGMSVFTLTEWKDTLLAYRP